MNECLKCGNRDRSINIGADDYCSICWKGEAHRWRSKCGELMDVIRRAEVLLSELYTSNGTALTQFEEAKNKLNV